MLLNERTLTSERVEVTLACHLLFGTYLLGKLALPALEATPGSRMVAVSSGRMYNPRLTLSLTLTLTLTLTLILAPTLTLTLTLTTLTLAPNRRGRRRRGLARRRAARPRARPLRRA